MMKRPSDFKASEDLALVDSTTMNQHSCTASIWDRFCLCELSVLLLAKLQSVHVYVKTPCALHLTSILWKIPQHFVVCGFQGWVRLWSIDQSGCDCQSHHHGPKQCLKRSTNSDCLNHLGWLVGVPIIPPLSFHHRLLSGMCLDSTAIVTYCRVQG